MRGCEIPHAEARTEATLADGPLHPQQPGDARGRPFALPDASLRSRKFHPSRNEGESPSVSFSSRPCQRGLQDGRLLFLTVGNRWDRFLNAMQAFPGDYSHPSGSFRSNKDFVICVFTFVLRKIEG